MRNSEVKSRCHNIVSQIAKGENRTTEKDSEHSDCSLTTMLITGYHNHFSNVPGETGRLTYESSLYRTKLIKRTNSL